MISQATFNVLASGFFTVVGILLGSLITWHNTKTQSKQNYLTDAYTMFFSAAYWVISKERDDSFHELVSSAERLRLFCSPESEILVDQIVHALASNEKTSIVMKQLTQLRNLAKKDVGKR